MVLLSGPPPVMRYGS
ncbi:hypothetical protein YPPY66_3116, partial [Yersinia pestis PY-66]